MFILELSVTEKCNLGCPYCYVANKDSFMTKETFDDNYQKIHDFVRLSKQKDFAVSFFGGEPLLNWDLITYVVPILKADPLCKQIVLISNLTMLEEEKSKYLKDNNIGVSWSFDGLSSNESRPLLPIFENNNPKTNKRYESILDMYNEKKELILSHVNSCKYMVWPGNVHEMVDNYKFFKDWGITNPDYSLVRDDVWTEKDIKLFAVELEKLTNLWIEDIKAGLDVSIGFLKLTLLDSIFGLAKGKRPHGCFAGIKGAVMTSKGDFYPCQRFASKDMDRMDENHKFLYWAENLKPANYDKCKGCQLEQVCNAGCSFSQLRNDNKPVDSVCELYHIIYEQMLRATEELKEYKYFQKYIKKVMNNV
jgi:uncharacterized protein